MKRKKSVITVMVVGLVTILSLLVAQEKPLPDEYTRLLKQLGNLQQKARNVQTSISNTDLALSVYRRTHPTNVIISRSRFSCLKSEVDRKHQERQGKTTIKNGLDRDVGGLRRSISAVDSSIRLWDTRLSTLRTVGQ